MNEVLPPAVEHAEWARARERLLVEEKAATRMLDRVAAARRRLPVVPVGTDYVFDGLEGESSLLDLFSGRRQLIIYHFMFAPEDASPCPGCARKIDDIGTLAHLHARRTSFVVVARAPFERLAALRERKGWTAPFHSCGGSRFNADMGAMVDGTDRFGLSVFIRDDANAVFRSYFTTGRGVEAAGFRHLLDLTPYGRQEEWEDSPEGRPQSPTYGWGSDRDE